MIRVGSKVMITEELFGANEDLPDVERNPYNEWLQELIEQFGPVPPTKGRLVAVAYVTPNNALLDLGDEYIKIGHKGSSCGASVDRDTHWLATYMEFREVPFDIGDTVKVEHPLPSAHPFSEMIKRCGHLTGTIVAISEPCEQDGEGSKLHYLVDFRDSCGVAAKFSLDEWLDEKYLQYIVKDVDEHARNTSN